MSESYPGTIPRTVRRCLGFHWPHDQDRGRLGVARAPRNLAGSLFFASLVAFDLSPWPEVKRWLAACEARPALKRARNQSVLRLGR